MLHQEHRFMHMSFSCVFLHSQCNADFVPAVLPSHNTATMAKFALTSCKPRNDIAVATQPSNDVYINKEVTEQKEDITKVSTVVDVTRLSLTNGDNSHMTRNNGVFLKTHNA